MPPEEQASVDIGGNHDCHVAQMVRTQGNTQKDDEVVDEESISSRKPAVKVPLRVVPQVKLLKDVQVGQHEEEIYADNMRLINVQEPPDLEEQVLADRDSKRGVGEIVEGQKQPRVHLNVDTDKQGEAKDRGRAERGDHDLRRITEDRRDRVTVNPRGTSQETLNERGRQQSTHPATRKGKTSLQALHLKPGALVERYSHRPRVGLGPALRGALAPIMGPG